MSISAAEATQAAANYYKDITQKIINLTVEEIEKDESENVWLITLGISETTFVINASANKDYKIFKIDLDTAEVISMKIRKV